MKHLLPCPSWSFGTCYVDKQSPSRKQRQSESAQGNRGEGATGMAEDGCAHRGRTAKEERGAVAGGSSSSDGRVAPGSE